MLTHKAYWKLLLLLSLLSTQKACWKDNVILQVLMRIATTGKSTPTTSLSKNHNWRYSIHATQFGAELYPASFFPLEVQPAQCSCSTWLKAEYRREQVNANRAKSLPPRCWATWTCHFCEGGGRTKNRTIQTCSRISCGRFVRTLILSFGFRTWHRCSIDNHGWKIDICSFALIVLKLHKQNYLPSPNVSDL